jgi:hypothetical protein
VPDLQFQIESAASVPFAAVPMIAFQLRVDNNAPAQAVHSIALHSQIQIETPRRRYSASEQDRLRDLFGESERWSQTLRPMLWTHVDATVPAFSASASVDVRVPCSFDFNVAATKYFYGLSDGEVPLIFLFSGSCFYAGASGGLEMAPIPWSKEARFRLPIGVWREMMATYYPNSAWLRIRQDVFDRLYQYKSQAGLATWEEALERLLEQMREAAAAR